MNASPGPGVHPDRSALAGVVVLCALSWLYLLHLDTGMSGAAGAIAMPASRAWSLVDFAAMFAMWAVMMFAMMLPSAMPMMLLLARVSRQREARGQPAPALWQFVAGYLLAWTGFSLVATLANWVLHTGGVMTSMMGRIGPALAAPALIAAGLFQLTPLKDACLAHCRSPVGFLAHAWREGPLGELRMGLHHGLHCLGCCWLLMALLFVLGVMNLLWIAVLTIFVLLEKTLPGGRLSSRVAGIGLIIWGSVLGGRVLLGG